MAKKVLDEMPKEKPTKAEAEQALEAVEKEEKEARETCDKKCGIKKFILPAVIVLVVAIIGCVCFLGYRMIFGDNPVKITSKAIRGLKESIKDVKDDSNGMDKLLEGKDPVEISSKTTIKLPEGMGKYVINALIQSDSEKNAAKVEIDAKQNSTSILSLNALLNDNKLYFKLADTMKNYYYLDLANAMQEFSSSMKELESNSELINLVSKYDATKLIDYVADAIDDTFTKDDFKKSKGSIFIKDDTVKATKYTAKLTQEKAIKVAKAFAKKAKKDKDLIKIIAAAANASEDDIIKLFDELIDTEAENLTDEYVLYSVYVSSLGRTLGYGFEIEGLGEITIASKGDLTTIYISGGEDNQYFGYINIDEKSDDHLVITGSLMGMVTAEIDFKTDLDTVKKNKEYKQTVTVDFKLSAMGQSVKASLNSETTVKKISKIDVTDVKNAINLEKMTSSQSYQFEKELEKSSFYSLIEGLMSLSLNNSSDNYTVEAKPSNQKISAFADEAINVAKAAETKYVADSLDNKAKTCYTIDDLVGDYISSSYKNYKGKVVLTAIGDKIYKSVYLTDGKLMITNYSSDYINEYSVDEYSASSWNSSYNKCAE